MNGKRLLEVASMNVGSTCKLNQILFAFSFKNDVKRTDSINFAKEYRGYSNEDRQEKAMENDEIYLKGIPRNYGYKDTKKELIA